MERGVKERSTFLSGRPLRPLDFVVGVQVQPWSTGSPGNRSLRERYNGGFVRAPEAHGVTTRGVEVP